MFLLVILVIHFTKSNMRHECMIIISSNESKGYVCSYVDQNTTDNIFIRTLDIELFFRAAATHPDMRLDQSLPVRVIR